MYLLAPVSTQALNTWWMIPSSDRGEWLLVHQQRYRPIAVFYLSQSTNELLSGYVFTGRILNIFNIPGDDFYLWLIFTHSMFLLKQWHSIINSFSQIKHGINIKAVLFCFFLKFSRRIIHFQKLIYEMTRERRTCEIVYAICQRLQY